jgi:hypothetical protein
VKPRTLHPPFCGGDSTAHDVTRTHNFPVLEQDILACKYYELVNTDIIMSDSVYESTFWPNTDVLEYPDCCSVRGSAEKEASPTRSAYKNIQDS